MSVKDERNRFDMRDRLTKERRSWNMSRIRGKDATPEKFVRSVLHKLGYRFRLHGKKLPGRPDIVLAKHKTVIFVHGCFWHRHRGCKNCTTPTTNRNFWVGKLEGNAALDTCPEAAPEDRSLSSFQPNHASRKLASLWLPANVGPAMNCSLP